MSKRSTPTSFGALFTSLVVIALAACTEGVDWTARERENAAHIRASLEAVSDAASVSNEAASDSELLARRNRILQSLRSAHLHASEVNDNVLDKLHPQLYAKFRLGYQRALARMIQAYEAGDVSAAQDAAADVQDFINWYRENRHRFRWWDEAMPA